MVGVVHFPYSVFISLSSSSPPVNGSISEQTTETKDTQVTNSLVADVRVNPQVSSLAQDLDKNKKFKHEGAIANKTLKTQEVATPGLKRSASTSGTEETQVQQIGRASCRERV